MNRLFFYTWSVWALIITCLLVINLLAVQRLGQDVQPCREMRADGRRFEGSRIDLTVKDAGLRQFLAFVSKESGVEIISHPDVGGVVNLDLRAAPWDLTLYAALIQVGADYRRIWKNVVYVFPLKE